MTRYLPHLKIDTEELTKEEHALLYTILVEGATSCRDYGPENAHITLYEKLGWDILIGRNGQLQLARKELKVAKLKENSNDSN